MTPQDKKSLRQAIAEGLPQVAHAGAITQQPPALTYVPPSHAKALDPENSVVEGIRGAGKSFWWAALSSTAVSYTHLDVYKRQPLRSAARRQRGIAF